MAVAASSGATVAASPTFDHEAGTLATQTFGAIGLVVTGGVPSSYSWSISGASLGTFSIPGSTTSSTCVAQVAGVAHGDTANADLVCSAVVNGVTYTASANLQYSRT